MNKQEQMKQKIKQQDEERKKELQDRNARKALMSSVPEDNEPQDEPEENVNVKVNREEVFTITINPLTLRLKDPEQTFGMKAERTELIGCFFEPAVSKAFKADQKKKGRGWQSHLVNELVKQYYKDKGSL